MFPSGPNVTSPPLWFGKLGCGIEMTSRAEPGSATTLLFLARLYWATVTSPSGAAV